MEPDERDEMLRALVRIAVNQDAINADIRVTLQRQDGINERLTQAIERLDVTQARIETLLSRMLRQDGNGTDA
jgi:hypothetical protein